MRNDPTRRAFLGAAAAAPALALPACKVCPAPPPPIESAPGAGDLLGAYTEMVAAVEAARSVFADRLVGGLGPRWLAALTRHGVRAEPLSRAEWARRAAERLLPARPVRIVTPRFAWDCEDDRSADRPVFSPEACAAAAVDDAGRLLYPAAFPIPFATRPMTVHVRGGARTFVGFLDAILGTLAAEVRFHFDEAARVGPVADPVVDTPQADITFDANLVFVFFRVLAGHGPLLA